MKRASLFLAGALALSFLQLGPSQASIPPSISLLVLSEDPRAEALSRAYLEFLSANQNFLAAAPPISRWQARDCLKGANDMVSCISRQIAAKTPNNQAPPVVLVAQPRRHGVYWHCIGIDPAKVGKTRKTVGIDLKEALFGTQASQGRQRTTALGCLFGAAAEANGNIRQ